MGKKRVKTVLGHQVRNLEMGFSGYLLVGSSKTKRRKPVQAKGPCKKT